MDFVEFCFLFLLLVVGGFFLIMVAVRKGMFRPQVSYDPTLSEFKFCKECGKQIKRRAELCPLCGCRQAGM